MVVKGQGVGEREVKKLLLPTPSKLKSGDERPADHRTQKPGRLSRSSLGARKLNGRCSFSSERAFSYFYTSRRKHRRTSVSLSGARAPARRPTITHTETDHRWHVA